MRKFSEAPDAVTVLLHLKHKTIIRPYVISVFRFSLFLKSILSLSVRKHDVRIINLKIAKICVGQYHNTYSILGFI